MSDLSTLMHDAAELAPTTLDRELHRPFPVRTTLAAAAAVVLVVGAATAISGRTDQHKAGPAATESPSTPKSRAQAGVDALVKDVVVPDDAVEQDTPPAPHLQEAAQSYADPEHEADASRFWTTSMSVDDTLTFLHDKEPAGLGDGGGIDAQGPGYHVRGVSGGDSRGALQIQVEARPDGRTGIRADAEVLWHPERTPAQLLGTVTSVEVTVVNGIPSHVEGHATLTGTPAQNLADLIDAAAISVGRGGCTGDGGAGATLVFRRSGSDVRVTLNRACFALTYDDGDNQLGLGLPPEVTAAVLKAVGRSDF